MFVSTGLPDDDLAFVSNNGLLATEVYTAIVNSIERIKGHGIRWMLMVDPKLR